MLKRDVTSKIIYLLLFFAFISLYKTFLTRGNWVDFTYIPLWIGGLLGLVVADIDQLIYVYYLKPGSKSSVNFKAGLENSRYMNAIKYLLSTKEERVGYFNHSVVFQLFYIVFAFLIITSSGNLLGRGLMLGMLLSLVVDQACDIKEKGNITAWFRNFPLRLDLEQQKWYVAGMVVVLLVLGLFF